MAVEGLAAQAYDYDVVRGSLMSQLLWDLFLSLERCHERVAECRLLQSYSASHASEVSFLNLHQPERFLCDNCGHRQAA